MIRQFNSLGEAWVNLVELTVQEGDSLSDEGREVRNVLVSFPSKCLSDPLIEKHGDPHMITQMHAVFFKDGANGLGHSYSKLMRGPAGRGDLKDVIEILLKDRWSKRATVTFYVDGGGKVPCINVIQFLVRNNVLEASYFARGQDAFRKFYADGLCLASMTRKIAGELNLPAGQITGFLSSSHVYNVDMPAIQQFREQNREHLRCELNGVG